MCPLGAAIAATVLFILTFIDGDGSTLAKEAASAAGYGTEEPASGGVVSAVTIAAPPPAAAAPVAEGKRKRYPHNISGTFKGTWAIGDAGYSWGLIRGEGRPPTPATATASAGNETEAAGESERRQTDTENLLQRGGLVGRRFGGAAFRIVSVDSSVPSMADVTGDFIIRDGWGLRDEGHRIKLAGVYMRDEGRLTFGFEAPRLVPLTADEVQEEGEEYRTALVRLAGEAVSPNLREHEHQLLEPGQLGKRCRYIADLRLRDWDFLQHYADHAAELDGPEHDREPGSPAQLQQGNLTTSADAAMAAPVPSTAFTFPLNVTGSITSSNCDEMAMLTTRFRVVQLTEVYYKGMNYFMIVLFVSVAQVALISRQIRDHAASAGAAAKVSIASIAMLTLIDFYSSLVHFTGGMVIEPLFLPFLWTAFAKFVIFSAYELRYIMMLRKARNPQAFADWHRTRRELSNMYSKFYGMVFVGLVIVYMFSEHMRLFLLLLYSFWVPQVVYSVLANARRPMLPSFVVGTSLIHLVGPLYLFGYGDNVLQVETNYRFCLTLVAWVALQVTVVMTQYYYGPRCFVPAALLPKRYSYFRPLPASAGGGGATAAAAGGALEDGHDIESGGGGSCACSVAECVICMSEVDTSKLSGRMVTPCNHIFHVECLRTWMEVKLECPTCRSPLPPED